MTISLLLLVLALGFLVASVAGKLPLWASLLCVILERLVSVVPLR